MDRRTGAALGLIAAIVLAGAVVRFARIGARPLWYDEIASVRRATGDPAYGWGMRAAPVPKPPPFGAAATDWDIVLRHCEPHPPLYFVFLHGWTRAVGGGPGALRAPSAGASVLAVAAGAALAWTLAGRRAGVIAAALLAAAPLEVEYAQEARAYAFVSLAALAATLVVARVEAGAARRPRLSWALYAGIVAAALWASYVALLIPVAHLAHFAIARRPPALAGLPWAVGAALLLAAPIALLARPAGMGPHVSWLWRSAPPGLLDDAVVHASRFLGGLGASRREGAALALGAGALGLACLLRGGARARVALVGGVAGTLACFGFDAATGSHAAREPRYAIASSGCAWTALANGAARLHPLVGLPLVGGVLALEARLTARAIERPGRNLVDVAAAAAALDALGCDRSDLVIGAGLGTVGVELATLVRGDPAFAGAEALAGDVLARPWRSVFLVERIARPGPGERARAAIAARFPEREVRVAGGLAIRRFAAE